MAKFTHFQHKRYRVARNVADVDLGIDAKAAYAGSRRSVIPLRDRVSIAIWDGDSVAYLDFTDEEIDTLIIELSRLKRFNDPKLHLDEGEK